MLILLVVVVVVAAAAIAYNSLVQIRYRVKNAWSQIDVQLKRRHDLIPNLVEAAKGYMQYEKDTLEKVIQARNQAQGAVTMKDKAATENMLTGALKSLFAVVEKYPDLKANQNVMKLQEELTSTENKIAFSRQYYNDEVTNYNTMINKFPLNMMASGFNYKNEELFELKDIAEKEPPKVAL